MNALMTLTPICALNEDMQMIKNMIYISAAIALSLFIAKKIAMDRVTRFASECLSQSEIATLHDRSDTANRDDQLEISVRGVKCVREKQTWPERLITGIPGGVFE